MRRLAAGLTLLAACALVAREMTATHAAIEVDEAPRMLQDGSPIAAEVTARAIIEVENCSANRGQLETLFTNVYAELAGIIEEYVKLTINCEGNITFTSTTTPSPPPTISPTALPSSTMSTMTMTVTTSSPASSATTSQTSTSSTIVSNTSTSITTSTTAGCSTWCGTEALCLQLAGVAFVDPWNGIWYEGGINGIHYQQDNNAYCVARLEIDEFGQAECDFIGGHLRVTNGKWCMMNDPLTGSIVNRRRLAETQEVLLEVLIQIPVDASTTWPAYNVSAVSDIESDFGELNEVTQVIALNVRRNLVCLKRSSSTKDPSPELDANHAEAQDSSQSPPAEKEEIEEEYHGLEEVHL